MNKKHYIVVFYMLTNILYGQSIVVEYLFIDRNVEMEAELVINKDFSIYTLLLSKLKEDNIFQSDEFNSKTTIITPKKDLHFIKNFKEEKIYYKNGIFNKNVFVTDSLNIFDWKIESDTLSVLGLKCRKASLSFRGRNYEAFFTDEIKISEGPWKFNGLPGLILKIKSLDGIYSFEAKKITRNQKEEFEYDEFLKEYREGRLEMNFSDFEILNKQKLKEYYEKQLSEYEEKNVITKITNLEVFFDYPEQ